MGFETADVWTDCFGESEDVDGGGEIYGDGEVGLFGVHDGEEGLGGWVGEMGFSGRVREEMGTGGGCCCHVGIFYV